MSERPGTPAYLRRPQRFGLIVTTVWMGVNLLSVIVTSFFPRTLERPWLISVIAWIMYTSLFFLWTQLQIGRVCRKAKACEYRMCHHCLYDLRSIHKEGLAGGACPECGNLYSFKELSAWWKRWARRRIE